ncbi:MAG: hypothetical protein LC667_11380 [Thioalkalivibrio sp.]|nr:hypothetical protein [Thioalkalivibrio sp.]
MESPLHQKEQSLRADGVALGERVREAHLPAADALLRVYESAVLVYSPSMGTVAVHGPLFHAWLALGAEAGLGYPLTDELAADAEGRVRYTRFRPLPPQPGTDAASAAIVHWDGHTRVLRGGVGAAWCDAFRGRGLLPLSDTMLCEDGVGESAHFVEGDGGAFGSIHHHPATGAAYVRAGIRDRWLQLGGERGLLGYPTETEAASHTGRATLQRFRDPSSGALTGTIAAHPDGRAFAAYGPIHARWMELGADGGPGDPFTDVFLCPDGVGTLVHFRDGAGAESSIYHTPQTGAHRVRGAIRDLWAELGWEQSELGYPVDEETETEDGARTARFQHGSIEWSAETGARVRE